VSSKTTRNHDEIRKWAQERGAVPCEVAGTERNSEAGILRFEFSHAPDRNDRNLKEISWDEFFAKFDENNLQLLYQDHSADGAKSNFNKIIHAEHGKDSGQRPSSQSQSKASGKKQAA
jgi:hypothetical protein